MKHKKRRSYLYLSNDDSLSVYQYEVMPLKPFIKGQIRSSWQYFDTAQSSLEENITDIISAYIEDKNLCITLGGNPCEKFIFRKNELKDLAIDFILAKKYFKLLDEFKSLEEDLLEKENKLDYFELNSYGHKSSQIALYKELLKNRNYNFNKTMFNYIEIDALKEFEKRENEIIVKNYEKNNQ